MSTTNLANENYKAKLLVLREQLTRRVNLLENAIRETITAPGEISTVRTHNADSDSEGLDEDLAATQNEERLLEAVEAALARMESGEYGTCQKCHQPIPEARLDALPFTPYCVQCAAEEEQSPAGQ